MSKSIEGILSVLLNQSNIIDNYSEQFGYVTQTTESLVLLIGLPDVTMGELIAHNGSNTMAVVLHIGSGYVKALLLTDYVCNVGDIFIRTKKEISVCPHESMLGKILNGLGKGPELEIPLGQPCNIFPKAKNFTENEEINRQLFTGINLIDWMIPIGYGQRQAIIGDKQSGKSTLSHSIMEHQCAFSNVITIYVLIGQCMKEAKYLQDKLRSKQNNNFIIFHTGSSDIASLRYFVPYVATTVGEYFMNQGKDVIIFYDNLDTHAKAYRELSNLLNNAPGKETYPKDVFFQHSKLLERGMCAKVGTLTLFPVVSIIGTELDYISTNIISITDGQIICNSELLQSNSCPGIDVGLSVSRIGTSVMDSTFKKLTKGLKLHQINNIQEKRAVQLESSVKAINKSSIIEYICQQRIGVLYEKWQQILLLKYLEKTTIYDLQKVRKFIESLNKYENYSKKILAYNEEMINSILVELN